MKLYSEKLTHTSNVLRHGAFYRLVGSVCSIKFFPTTLRIMTWTSLLFSLLGGAGKAADGSGELWTLQPGVVRHAAQPETWTLDLRGTEPVEAARLASRLSSRLYGPAHGPLHEPLRLLTDFSEPKALGLHVTGLAREEVELGIRIDNKPFYTRKWPAGTSGQRVNALYSLPIPAGEVEIIIEAKAGAASIDHYFIAKSEDKLPTNLARLRFASDEEAPNDLHHQPDVSRQDDGYRGIWYTLGQFSEYGDKYSGGLGTYTANHIPLAIHAPEVDKTFFVYGGTAAGRRHLLAMVSYYDHANNRVPRPTVVHDRRGVNDAHDNPSLSIDRDGYIWVFVSGRMTWRPGFIYRSKRPYDVSEFDFIETQEFTYPQPWYFPEKGFFHLMTKYRMTPPRGRLLYWKTSPDGIKWSKDHHLADLGGHYQVSNVHGDKIGTFFNRHPGGTVDRRTDLYYLQTTDFGETWTTVDGTPVAVPLLDDDNPARVVEYSAQGKLVYTVDLNFDRNGYPVLLYVTSHGHQPGPDNDPRDWVITKWNGSDWESHVVTRALHNYDLGGLYITDDEWRIIAPTEPGPQHWGTGGEIAFWVSRDEGRTWTKERQVTQDSEFNHTYARRPLNARDPFFSFWADGHADALSKSRLYFGNADGTKYWKLPYDMDGDFAEPIPMKD